MRQVGRQSMAIEVADYDYWMCYFMCCAQQIGSVAMGKKNAKRLFCGKSFSSERQKSDELFGVENLFQLRRGDSCLTTDILLVSFLPKSWQLFRSKCLSRRLCKSNILINSFEVHA